MGITYLDIDQPSIVKTFTNAHNINHDIYYEENKSPRSKYMNEFIDLKQLNAKQSKYKHKKTNRTPKMKRVRKKHSMDKKQTVDFETIQKNINLDIQGMNSPTVVETIIEKQMSTGSTDVLLTVKFHPDSLRRFPLVGYLLHRRNLHQRDCSLYLQILNPIDFG